MAIRLQAIAIRLEAIAVRLEAIAIRLEAMEIRRSEASAFLDGFMTWSLGRPTGTSPEESQVGRERNGRTPGSRSS